MHAGTLVQRVRQTIRLESVIVCAAEEDSDYDPDAVRADPAAAAADDGVHKKGSKRKQGL